jgi:hypothetical protein
MALPEFGGEFTDLDDQQKEAIVQAVGLDDGSDLESIFLFRTNTGVTLYVEIEPENPKTSEPGGSWVKADLDNGAVEGLRMPTSFRIDAKVPLPDSVPLAYLAVEDKEMPLRPRRNVLTWLQDFIENEEYFSDVQTLEGAKAALVESHGALNRIDQEEHLLLQKRLELAEKLLIDVAGIGRGSFQQLQAAVKNHDGYANAIVAKMNKDLAEALNFRRWWSQDSDFSLSLTLRDFDLVFTVRDRTESEYAFSERSGGMSYFLSYFVQYLSHEPADEQEILLMDEPDAYLSMQGQQDLLRIFEAFAAPEEVHVDPIQVIYVTHSPFLIDKNHSERIRVLEKGDGDEGTRHVANAGRNHYEPLRSAFGAFVAETTFISNCNLMLEGQADQVLLAGISSMARRGGSVGESLDLNTLSLVPSGSAEHIPYMVYLARGRDVDKPAVIVLLDGDDEADGIAKELSKGYRGKRYIDDDLVIKTSDVDLGTVKVDVDNVREIEDLIPAELAVLAVHRFADEVLGDGGGAEVRKQLTTLPVPAGKKLFKTVEEACKRLEPPLRLSKVGFARAALEALEKDANESLRSITHTNFEVLFTMLVQAQQVADRRNSRDRVRQTVRRHLDAFERDHKTSALRREVAILLGDIDSQLTEVTQETEGVKSALRLIAVDFKLAEDPGKAVEPFDELVRRLAQLPYEGLQAVQDHELVSLDIEAAN